MECGGHADRKSTRLNSSHTLISYAVFCLKKKKSKSQGGRGSKRRCRTGARATRATVVSSSHASNHRASRLTSAGMGNDVVQFFPVIRLAAICKPFPYTTLFRS